MKITILSPPFNLTGGQRAVATYAQKLHDRGHEVVVVSSRCRKPTLRQIARDLVRHGLWPEIGVNSFSHFSEIDPECRVASHFGPLRDEDVPDANVVIATWWETAEWVAALSPSKGVKVHYMQDYEIWGGSRERVDASCRLPLVKILIAQWVGDLLSDKFGITDYTIIPCAVDMNLFYAEPRGKQSRPTVGMHYNTFRNKGADISLKAFEIARQSIPDLHMVAFSAQKPISKLPLPAGCDFTRRAPNEELRNIYSKCDAWLFGTRIEGFGLPILEAMACRTPVVGTPAGAAPQLIGQGGGYLVRPEDPQDMADAIVRLVSLSEDQWRVLSDTAYATASQYSWAAATDRFEAVLVNAVERSRAATLTS